jgi:hypothetical protein
MKDFPSPRRSFLTGLGAAAITAAGVGAADAQTAARPAGAFKAPRHADDDWMDTLPGKHRMVIDAVTPHGAGEAILYANNLYEANKPYGLTSKDLAIIVVMRHFATPFAFNDEIWAKYGKPMGEFLKFMDPKTKQPPSTNLYNASTYGMELPNLGATIDGALKNGTHIAICDVATHFVTGMLAGQGGDANAVYTTFKSNALPQSHFVSAGVVAVNRAQERGYTLIYAG